MNMMSWLVGEILKRLKLNNMKINKKKIQFASKSIKLLGVKLNGISQSILDIKKNEAMEYPRPTNVSEQRRFLCLTE